MKLAFLLSGGGEFAFVVLALAERLEVLPKDLGGLLTAIVLITMAVTPLLGEVAAVAAEAFVSYTEGNVAQESAVESQVAEDAVVVCGYGEIGKEVVYKLGLTDAGVNPMEGLPQIVAFDTEPALIDNILIPMSKAAVMYGDGCNPEVVKSHGVCRPRAIFISYEHHEQVMAATCRLRTSFINTPIFARAQSRVEAEELKSAGATEVVVERDELPRSAPALLNSERMRASEMSGINLLKNVNETIS